MKSRYGFVIIILINLTLFMYSSNKKFSNNLKGWIVEANYPVASPEKGQTIRIKWKYEVREKRRINGHNWLHIYVADLDGGTPVKSDFWLDPQNRSIWRIHIDDYFHGQWHERNVGPDNPTNFYVSMYCPIPLDYYGVASSSLDKNGMFSFEKSKLYTAGKLWRFKRRYFFTIKNLSAKMYDFEKRLMPDCEIAVRSARSKDSYMIFWVASSFPWWLKYESSRFKARVLNIDYEDSQK